MLPRHSGFTLLEILVVLVLIGIITSVALLSVRLGGEERLLHQELRRIDRLVELALDESRFRLIELGLEFGTDGYRFVQWDGQDWQPLPEPGPLRPRSWPPETRAALHVDDLPVALGPLTADRYRPQVVLASDGELSPFLLVLETTGGHRGSLALGLTGDSELRLAGVLQ